MRIAVHVSPRFRMFSLWYRHGDTSLVLTHSFILKKRAKADASGLLCFQTITLGGIQIDAADLANSLAVLAAEKLGIK